MLQRCKVSFAVLATDYGRTGAPGDLVDLAERLPRGGMLGDLVRPEWFDPIEPVTDPVPARGRRTLRAVPGHEPITTDEPGEPATEE